MNRIIAILSSLFLLFIAKYFPSDHALIAVLSILGFVAVIKTMNTIEKKNKKISDFLLGAGFISGSVIAFITNDYIMFPIFNSFLLALIIELLWFQPKEIIVRITSENNVEENKNSV